jgi:hypothetical protein
MGKKARRGVRAALFPASSLTSMVANGLQAMSGVDRDRITVDPPGHVHDSLALDDRNGSTGEWDYLLGIDERHWPVIGVEVHPATNGEVASVIAKQQRSVAVLQAHMPVVEIRRWIWISSGKDTVSRGSTEWRKLIKARIELVGRHLSLP